jgi:phosphoribosyl 1,2-cyclic phosphodiesterase
MKAGIEVYASYGTLEQLDIAGKRKATCLNPYAHDFETIGSFKVFSYDSHHDARMPLLFCIEADGEYLLFATDTSFITQKFWFPFSIIAIECSFDKDVLANRVKEKTINEVLAKRLLTSHMEKSHAMDYIAEYCDTSKCQEIHLLHLSGDNLNKRQTRQEFDDRFMIDTIIV